MKKKQKELLNRYSLMAGAFLGTISQVDATIVVTNPPDAGLPGAVARGNPGGIFNIDFNNDGTDDVRVRGEPNRLDVEAFNNAAVRFLGVGAATTSASFLASALQSSKSVPVTPTGGARWGKNSNDNCYLTFNDTFGAWRGQTSSRYLGVLFQISGNDYYGWIRMNIPAVGQVNIEAFGYNDQQGQGIPPPLPVELTSFNAVQLDNAVKLLWETATEINNYGFEIERQETGNGTQNSDWEKIGFVKGHGNSNSPKSYEFLDENLPADKLEYRLKQIDTDGSFEYFNQTVFVDLKGSVTSVDDATPTKFNLAQNYPNPFNPATKINFAVAERQHVRITVFNVVGEKVGLLVDRTFEPGEYNVNFEGSNLPSGMYIYKLEAGELYTAERKMMLLR